jgi:hypothetical protein
MSPLVLAACCVAASVVLLVLVRRFGVRHWIWQVLSLALAIVVASIPASPHWSEPGWIIVLGLAFFLLYFWAVSESVTTVTRHFPRWLRRH